MKENSICSDCNVHRRK